MAKRMFAIAAVITVSFVIAIFAGSGEDTEVSVRSPKLDMSSAAVPQMLNYQGVLTDGGGNPLDATVSMVFTIYDASSGGTVLWTETHGSVTVVGGLFTVLLGSVTPLIETVFDDPDRWLGLAVDGDPEMARERMASVPYAYKCGSGDGGDDIYVNEVGPESMSGNSSDPILSVINSGSGHGVYGESQQGGTTIAGVSGRANGGGGAGVYGEAVLPASIGVHGVSEGDGVHGESFGEKGKGVKGIAYGDLSYGIYGSSSYIGVFGSSNGPEHYGVAGNSYGQGGTGVIGECTEEGGYGVWGHGEIGVKGLSSIEGGIGVYGRSYAGGSGTWAGYFLGDTYISGYVGIGMESPAHPLHLQSGAYVSSGGVWTNASSIENKENITDLALEHAVETLEGLNPVTFNYIVNKDENHVGFIAEDVPDLVATGDRKGLSPMDIIGVLTKVVQEQQKTIEELRNDIAELKNQ